MTPLILRWWIIKNSYCSKYGIFLKSIHRLVFVMETQYVWTLRLTRKCLVVHFLWTTVWDFQSSVSCDVVCLYFELILFVSEMALCFPFKHISSFVKVGTERERGQQQLTCDLTGFIWCDLQGFSSRMCALSSMAHGAVAALSLTQLVVLSNTILVSTALLWPSVAHDCFSSCTTDFCLWVAVQVLQGREISGPLQRRQAVPTRLYSKQQLFSRTLGHLSAVYCLLFDRSGHYVITVSVHSHVQPVPAVFKNVQVVT